MNELALCLSSLEGIPAADRISYVMQNQLVKLRLEYLLSAFREKAERLSPILNKPEFSDFRTSLQSVLSTYIKRAKSLLHLHETADISGMSAESQALVMLSSDFPALIEQYFRNDLFHVPNVGSSITLRTVTGADILVPVCDERDSDTFGGATFDRTAAALINAQLDRMKGLQNYPLRPFYQRLSIHPSRTHVVYKRDHGYRQSLEVQLKHLQVFLMARKPKTYDGMYVIADEIERMINLGHVSEALQNPIIRKIRDIWPAQPERAKILLLRWVEDHFIPDAQRR